VTFRLHIWVPGLLGLVLSVLVLAACGGGSSTSDSSTSTSTAAPPAKEERSANREERSEEPTVVEVKGTGPKPTLHYPPHPPRHVVTRVLKEGSGPVVRPGDQLAARYVGGGPKTKYLQDFWSEENPYRFRLGGNQLGKAWVIGLSGMRLGGRRELIVPSRLAYDDGMMVYVIEPLALEKRASGH
jgi:FKBP-type peptidyl-prolyl cis-trans isomerase